MSDLQAAYLWAQLEAADRSISSVWRCGKTTTMHWRLWQKWAYRAAVDSRWLRAERAYVYIKLRDIDDRSALINFLKERKSWRCFITFRCTVALRGNTW